jgi:hypothetical protein
MRTSTDCTSRADECRRLAKLVANPEDWQHFIEMAATWDILAKQRKADKQVADEEVGDGQVAAQQVANEQVADEQGAAQKVADEHVADEEIVDEEITDEEITDEQLAAILALADGIANSSNLGLQ